jgi:hypothetical protein
LSAGLPLPLFPRQLAGVVKVLNAREQKFRSAEKGAGGYFLL